MKLIIWKLVKTLFKTLTIEERRVKMAIILGMIYMSMPRKEGITKEIGEKLIYILSYSHSLDPRHIVWVYVRVDGVTKEVVLLIHHGSCIDVNINGRDFMITI